MSETEEQTVQQTFVHLHNHTDFSLLDGAAPIKRYMEKAKNLGMTSLAITDHGNMFGSLRFYNAAKDAGINPIIGCEFYCNPTGHTERPAPGGKKPNQYHLILLAMNEQGYHNLMELNSISYTEGFYFKPRIDDELLKQYNEGLICLSACLGGEILQHLLNNQYELAKERALWFSSVFDDGRYFLELQDHNLAEQKRTNPLLKQLSDETGIPLVCTNDIHYIDKSDANAQDLLLCVGTNSKKNDPDRMRFPNQEFYMKTQQEMHDLFSWCPEALENTVRIAQRCNLEIHFPGPLLPDFEVPEGFADPADYLRHLSNEGLRKRYTTITEELQKRLDYELDVIIKMKFEGYFLIVMDYIQWAKQHDIPVGPGRGSGAGSLVAYSIEITDVDPIKFNLLFERFLNPERVSMPDFDIDFCFERRQEVINYVTDHYGTERVAQIATFGTLKAKAVVKDVARVLDIPFDESNNICKLIPDDPKMTLAKAFEQNKELGELEDRGGIYAELFDAARRLEGLNRHTSTHAAGVVIGKEQLVKYVPLYRDAKTGAISTQYTMDLIEECGLVKMDFLGLKTLTLIKHTEDLIHKKDPSFNAAHIDEEDPKTFSMLCKGDSTAVFQFESQGMQNILKEAKPSNIEDLVALNALYRPGPMAYIPQFVNCKLGKQPITYANPELEEELKTTYGVIVYQEQVMKVAQIIAGYSLGSADILRRIMGKKKVAALEKEKVKFIAGAKALGRSEQHANEIFEMLEPFAGYGFNKSHAVAYSVVAYQTAFLKANYPAEFWAANLTNEMGSPDKFSEYLQVAKDQGLEILPPSVNYSDKHFSVVDGKIVYGLAGIKNVGEGVVELLVRERDTAGPFKDFLDFLTRLDTKAMNTKLLESLIKAGAFDTLGTNRPTLLENLGDAITYVQKRKEATAYGQISLFDEETEASMETFSMREVEDWKIPEKLEMEKGLLGFYISGHPLDAYAQAINQRVTVNTSKLEQMPFGRPTNIIAMVSSIRPYTTQKGGIMGFLQLTDRNATFDATLFPKMFEQYRDIVRVDGIFGFIGKFDNSRGNDKISFLIEQIFEDPNQLAPLAVSRCHIELEKSFCSTEHISHLRDTCLSWGGNCSLLLHFREEGEELGTIVECGREFSVRYCDDLVQALQENPAILHIWFD
ncbi:MAG: DNA polymerase III subunit alpha [Sphaerochaeta sp.]|uniref:DNA polymerase III subunit alpha n=1 Tax=Sphaerochaeta sp. TaxID=1972642 RepID=UPI00297A8D14|nr:DNA polymerase III subunit alpha [uncultured Sphaerochaeta sp.]MDD3056955.1 DNA polymerase III subunit alpha [Sphaerochaeta sp.]MDD3928503.1 DNA polymerase III subunit alpha [Sphaerochaeta sp.]